MDLSETIMAAMIGALATVSTALFQLFSAIRQRKADIKPRKGSTLRSVLAVLALMVASAAGGFLCSEFLKERNAVDLRAMRDELRELKVLTAAAAQSKLESDTRTVAAPIATAAAMQPALAPVDASESEAGSSESIAYVPACRRDIMAPCAEAEAQRIALCGSIPAYATVRGIDLYAQPDAVQRPWEQHRAALEQDLGGARFTGRWFEYAQGGQSRAVCINFSQWSSEHPYIARIVIAYGFGAPEQSEPQLEPVALTTPAVIAADTLSAVPNTGLLASPAQ